jgi:xylan 1,4-beta-xylosidase
VNIDLKDIPSGRVLVNHYRIDQEYSNSYTLWKKMGSPQNPDQEQIAALEKAGRLKLYKSPEWINMMDGKAVLKMELPRQGVSLLQFLW